MRRAIWWVRRDLRLNDNPALAAALDAAGEVVPVFVRDPRLLESEYAGEKRLAFLHAGLACLGEALRRRGGRLVVRSGEPVAVLKAVMEQSEAQTVFAQPDVSPFARRRDRQVEATLPVRWEGEPAVHPPGSVLKKDGGPYSVFTPFSRAWKDLDAPSPGDLLPAPERVPFSGALTGDPLPEAPRLPEAVTFPAGEAEARRRLDEFTQGSGPPVYDYARRRDRMDLDGTSRLSPYLRFGMLSAREAVVAAREAIQAAPDAQSRRGAETWLGELIWRDFYLHILFHFPRVRSGNFRLVGVRWENDPDDLAAWQAGRTGYPVVDAAMRQLVQSGWMHNRARMVAASFLTKDLLVDWQAGERYFMQHLVDGDPASNNGGWQWAAGTGTDAAPYFRIFNPVSQSKKHDPQGRYIRRWLPELERVPDAFVHEPWKMPEEVQKQAGCRIGRDYPGPIVDHAWARERALQVYRQAG